VTLALVTAVVVLALALAVVSGLHLRDRIHRSTRSPVTRTRRILFPFMANALSTRALDASLRLASAEEATLVPVFLARVSLDLPLDTPIPRQCNLAIPLQEAIEQRAAAFGVAVDSRIERGRTYRHALRIALDTERYDRIVVAAAAQGSPGFSPDDIAWLLETAPGEIVVLRPDKGAQLVTPPQRRFRRPRPRDKARRADEWHASGQHSRTHATPALSAGRSR
jgi:hypothetical protein